MVLCQFIKGNDSTKDGRKWYYKCQYRDILGTIKTKKSKKYYSKLEAQNAEAKFITENNGLKNNFSVTFDDIFLEYIENKKDKVKKQTLGKDIQLNRYISKYLGKTKINELTVPQYRQFKQKLNEANLLVTYKNKIHNMVKQLIKTAYTLYGLDNKSPDICDKFYNKNFEKKEMQFFTLEEFQKFQSVIKDLKWKTFFDILFFCGLRQSELQALTWKDVDFEKRTISINKTLTTKIKG